MKLIIKLLIILVISAVIAPLYIKGPDGKPLMQISDLLPANILPRAMIEPLGITPQTSTVRASSSESQSAIYRWQDEKGQWHYGDTPPAHTASESVTLQSVNTLPAPKKQVQQNRNTGVQLQSDVKSEDKAADLISGLPDSIDPADTAALLKQVQETQRIIKERQARIDALINDQ